MRTSIESLQARLCSTVKGSESAALELIAAILADGHVLIEGPPGVGKTTLVKTLADALSCDFRRVQFTPDLLPADLLGYSLYRQDRQTFDFIPGPVFTNLLLADEINRTSPRIQSALFECMNERQVTVDGTTRALPEMFHIVATQNNRFATGTFPLPEPQLDRFLASIEMSLPPPAVQVALLEHHASGRSGDERKKTVASQEEVTTWKSAVEKIPVSREICEYIIRICEHLRQNRELEIGLSNRAALALTRLSRAFAYLNGHDGVYPDDVKRSVIPVLAHRILPGDQGASGKDRSSQRRGAVALLQEALQQVAVD